MSKSWAFSQRLAAAVEAFVDPVGVGSAEPSPEDSQPLKERLEAPEPLDGSRSFVLVVLDSCRYDSFAAAQPKNLLRLGDLQRRWSWASWTGPSHYNLLTGLLPHSSPTHVFASSYYKSSYLDYKERLGVEVSFEALLPSLWLPHLLRYGLGYRTEARVSLPVLNPSTVLSRDFDEFRLMPKHNDFGAMLDSLDFTGERPVFYLLNLGETHYPYLAAGEDGIDLPHLSGVHGVVAALQGMGRRGQGLLARDDAPDWFDAETLSMLRQRQVDSVSRVDELVERLYDVVPAGTWITVCADHGELFGEDGWFGHGPIQHDKVYEVPLIEGRIR